MRKFNRIVFTSLLSFLLVVSSILPAAADIIKVDNLAPTAGFDVGKRQTIDLQVALGKTNLGTREQIESVLNEKLRPILNENGFNLNLSIKNNLLMSLDYSYNLGNVISSSPSLLKNNANYYLTGLNSQNKWILEKYDTQLKKVNEELMMDATNYSPQNMFLYKNILNFHFRYSDGNFLYDYETKKAQQIGWHNSGDGYAMDLNGYKVTFSNGYTNGNYPVVRAFQGETMISELRLQQFGITGGSRVQYNITKIANDKAYVTSTYPLESPNTYVVMINSNGELSMSNATTIGLQQKPFNNNIQFGNEYNYSINSYVLDENKKYHKVRVRSSGQANNNFQLIYEFDGKEFILDSGLKSESSGYNSARFVVSKNHVIAAIPVLDANNSLNIINGYVFDRQTFAVKKLQIQLPYLLHYEFEAMENNYFTGSIDEAAFIYRKKYDGGNAGILTISTEGKFEFESTSEKNHHFLVGINEQAFGSGEKEHLKKILNGKDTNFIGVGTSNNKSDFIEIQESVNGGSFLEHSNLEEVVDKLADYIIKEVTARKTADIQFRLENTSYDKNLIENKINEILKPKLNLEGIKPKIAFLEGETLNNAISSGGFHSIGLKPDGSVYSWGLNDYGQLGQADGTNKYVPTKIQGLKDIVKIVASGHQNFALDKHGDLWYWGYIELGVNAVGERNTYTPVKVPNLPKIIDMELGQYNFYAVADNGDIYGWGDNRSYQIRKGVTTVSSPYLMTELKELGKIKQVKAQGVHSLAVLTSTGDVYTRGRNTTGELALNHLSNYEDTFKKTELKNIKVLYDKAAINNNGELFVWGNNTGTNYEVKKVSYDKVIKSVGETNGQRYFIDEDGNFGYVLSDFRGLANTTLSQDILNRSNSGYIDYIVGGGYQTHIVTNNGSVYSFGPSSSYSAGWGTGGFNDSLISGHQFIKKKEEFTSGNSVLFASVFSDSLMNSDSLITELRKNNANFVGFGNTTNQSQIEQIITANNGQGVYLDHTDLDLAMENMAKYIIESLKDKNKIQLDLGIGSNETWESATISSKLNSLVIPKLNEEGIKVTSSKVSKIPNGSIIVPINHGWNGSFQDTGPIQPTVGNEFVLSKNAILDSFKFKMGSYSNVPSEMLTFILWDDTGKILGTTQINPSLENVHNTELTHSFGQPIKLIANKKYTLSVHYSRKNYLYAYSSGTEGTRQVNGISVTFKGVRNEEPGKYPTTYANKLSMFDLNLIENEASIERKGKSDQYFYGLLQSNSIDSNQSNNLLKDFLLHDVNFVGIGSNTNQNEINNIISKNMDRGTYIKNTDIDQSLIELAEYIIEEVKKKQNSHDIYLTLEEEAEYFTWYDDAEKDPKFAERWRYDQTPTVFEHDMGFASFNLKNLSSPINKFSKVGRYQTIHAARDTPIYWEDDAFDNYRKWSKEADNWYIFVHRKPVPDFAFTINGSTGDYTITNKAYDLDKQSIDIGFGGGLRSMEYHWRVQGSTSWQEGLPPNPLERKVYELRQTVEDFQGATESVIRLMDGTGINKPPIADFEPIPDMITAGESTLLRNKSYDPNGDPLRYEWFISTDDKKTWTQFSTGEHPQQQINDPGEVWFKVKAIETNMTPALSDESEPKKVTVLQNNEPPTACMQIPSPNYIGDTIVIKSCATDPDDDSLLHIYTVTKADGKQEVFSTGDSEINNNGDLTLIADQYPTDLGTWTVLQEVTDGLEKVSTTGSLVVLDQTVEGQVNHTAKWLENLQKYNAKFPSKAFNLDLANGLVEFVPGEKFMLVANETQEAVTIDVFIKEYRINFGTVNLIENGTSNIWNGELWDKKMIDTFKDGEELTFVFTAKFTNGWIDTNDVKVKIKDDSYWRQHTSY